MKRKKTCSNCAHGKPIYINKDILCKIHGPVAPDYVCSKHVFKRETKSFNETPYKCIDCEYFVPKKIDGKVSTIGLCSLFSVREYDGTKRRSCSKFIKKSEINMSIAN
jgi:hypothetical protein